MTTFGDVCGFAPESEWKPGLSSTGDPCPLLQFEKVQCLVWGIARPFRGDARSHCAAGVWKEQECEEQGNTSSMEIQTHAKQSH